MTITNAELAILIYLRTVFVLKGWTHGESIVTTSKCFVYSAHHCAKDSGGRKDLTNITTHAAVVKSAFHEALTVLTASQIRKQLSAWGVAEQKS